VKSERPDGSTVTLRRAAYAGLAAILLAVGVVIAVTTGSAERNKTPRRARSCEGLSALCARHLDEVVFAGTHNSFAASSEPGWHFANQKYGLARQLKDGIRALLLDVHFGVYDQRTGRVRTDLTAEGSDRNKVSKQLPASALHVADRLAGRVGLGTLSGKPQLYLCHTLCELGAEPLDRELRTLRDFLRRHPDEVLIVIVEDYVPPEAIASAFAKAGLDSYTVKLARGTRQPTLGSVVGENRRMVVFAEEKGGSPAWYMPAFSFIQDTPLGATRPSQLSCARYRGEGDSPILLVNHWIPPFPPNPATNKVIGSASFLRSRVERCMREREARGAIVAVDFYERTSVIDVARELNERG
jgi:hypothetical protein